VPIELVEGWEIYSAVRSGMVKPLTLKEWEQLPDIVVKQLLIITDICQQVSEAEMENKYGRR